MASSKLERSSEWVIDSEPRQRVDKRLMVVDTDAEDLLSGNGEQENRCSYENVCLNLPKISPNN